MLRTLSFEIFTHCVHSVLPLAVKDMNNMPCHTLQYHVDGQVSHTRLLHATLPSFGHRALKSPFHKLDQ